MLVKAGEARSVLGGWQAVAVRRASPGVLRTETGSRLCAWGGAPASAAAQLRCAGSEAGQLAQHPGHGAGPGAGRSRSAQAMHRLPRGSPGGLTRWQAACRGRACVTPRTGAGGGGQGGRNGGVQPGAGGARPVTGRGSRPCRKHWAFLAVLLS